MPSSVKTNKRVSTIHELDQLTNSLAQGQTLSLTSNDNSYFPAIKNSSNSNRQSHPRNCGYIVIEETGVGQDGIICESLNASTGGERSSSQVG